LFIKNCIVDVVEEKKKIPQKMAKIRHSKETLVRGGHPIPMNNAWL